MAALEFGIGKTPMLAYLVEMAVRLIELRRVLKPTGSLYLHCDPTASHYLKIVMDGIFGVEHFVNEIIWKRYGAHNDVGQGSRHFGRVHDVILRYGKSAASTWEQLFAPLDTAYVAETYRNVEPGTGRRFTTTPLTGPGGAAKGNPVFEWKGHTRAWRYSRETMERLDGEGKLHYSRTGYVRQKLYLDESRGVPVQDIWADVPSLSGAHSERLGYPTQKPSALLERIIAASSNAGDIVLDPFCGCGTAVVAAQKLGRRWIGIDITYLAIAVMRRRIHDSFPELPTIPVVGKPTEVEGARMLAEQGLQGRYQFQWWALDEIGAQPASGDHKKGADTGIDGRITFTGGDGSLQQVLVSVKSGKGKVDDVRVLKAVIEREKAAIGILVCLDEPTKPMQHEATIAGEFASDVSGKSYPRVQILSVADLLERHKRPELPPLVAAPYQRAAKVKAPVDQGTLFDGAD